jgi:hypothetical protein
MVAGRRHGVMAKMLLDSGMTSTSIDLYHGALHKAAFRGYAHIVKLVLETCDRVISFSARYQTTLRPAKRRS